MKTTEKTVCAVNKRRRGKENLLNVMVTACDIMCWLARSPYVSGPIQGDQETSPSRCIDALRATILGRGVLKERVERQTISA